MFPGVRLFKQTTIAIIVIVAFGLVGFGASKVFIVPAPTPVPTPEHVLKPVEILEAHLLQVEENDYDVLLKVQNPNPKHGTASASYELNFFNSNHQSIGTRSESFYILPGQTRYVLVTPLEFAEPVAQVEIEITSIKWQELDILGLRGVSLVSSSGPFRENPDTGVYGKVTGLVYNNSDFDVSKADAIVILFDEQDEPVAAGKSEIRTFIAQTTRGFDVSWYAPIEGNVVRTYIEAQANLFENSTFVRTYGNFEPFQDFY